MDSSRLPSPVRSKAPPLSFFRQNRAGADLSFTLESQGSRSGASAYTAGIFLRTWCHLLCRALRSSGGHLCSNTDAHFGTRPQHLINKHGLSNEDAPPLVKRYKPSMFFQEIWAQLLHLIQTYYKIQVFLVVSTCGSKLFAYEQARR